jgi:hypothetical protein
MTIQGYPYLQVVGNFMHAIINSRPNFSFVVNSLAQYLFNLGTICIHALKKVMWYTKGIMSLGIKYQTCEHG